MSDVQKEDNNLKDIDWDQFLPGISIDCVIFGYYQQELKILILEYKNTGYFALPGGFIQKNEALDEAAERTLRERTSLENIYLNQFHTFGNLRRHDKKYMRSVLKANGIEDTENHWLLQRFISVGYYALVDFSKVTPTVDNLSDSCEWYDLDNLPELIQDHRYIVETALETMRDNIQNKAVSYNLLSDTFTMADLRYLHETILDEKVNRSSFHRRMVNSGDLKRIGKKKTGGAHRAPYLYEFVKEE
jgi:ADP-ribose pyrophosphatase YjhB (NUDIX family)